MSTTVRKINAILGEDLASQLQNALTNMLAKTLRIDANNIDIHRPLPHYGLDSIDAVTLAGDLEDWLNVELPSTLLWDYSTVAAIAGFLEEQLEAMPEARARLACMHQAPPAQHAEKIDRLDHLDDEQVDALLTQLIP